jgi:glycosyltransferase involved in cell wall biosynthesis
LKFELARTENYEAHMARAFSRVLVTSLKDQQVFNQLAPGAPLTIIPNGVDLAYFSPPPEPQDDYDPDAIVISGKMSYHPNVAMVLFFVREILPLIWKRRPQAKLWVVGQNPSEEIRAACADERITVTGRVEDIRPYLQRAAVAATPITYGAGIQNKVLEALACATPVVASPLAISALQIHPEEEILVGADSAAFAAQVLRILDQPALRNRLGAAGRQFVQREHSWDAAAAQLEQVYQAVVSH